MTRKTLANAAMSCLLIALLVFVMLLTGCSSDKDQGTISGGGDERSDRVRDGEVRKATMPNQDSTKPETTPVASSYPNVAGHGILWKPVSDSDGKLAVLLKPSYGKPTVKVLDTSGRTLETGRFVYFSNPDRATYRFGRSGGSFPRPCLLAVGGQIFTVPDGSRRYE